MARGASKLRNSDATPTLEHFAAVKHNCVEVSTTAIELSRTDGSKGLYIQNGHASQALYIGGGKPQIIQGYRKDMILDFERNGFWHLSGFGVNEWYYALIGNADPGLTEATYLYYKTRTGDETLGTKADVSSLGAQHEWGWGNADTLGFNTIYIRTDGSGPNNTPKTHYEYILAYTFTLTADDTAATGGWELKNEGDFISITVDGSGKIFAIASGQATPAKILEVF